MENEEKWKTRTRRFAPGPFPIFLTSHFPFVRKMRRRGAALAMLIVAVIVGLGLWSQSMSRVNGQITIERQRPTLRPPDLGAALARTIACLRIAEPPSASYRCRLILGNGLSSKTFTASYTGAGGGDWTLTVSERVDVADPPCPECDPASTR